MKLRRPSLSKNVLAVAAIIAATALLLLAMGRTPWCQCGYIALWSGNIWSSQNSQQVADPYSFTHVTHGVIFSWLLKLVSRRFPLSAPIIPAVLMESSWELFENSNMVIDRYREVTISLDYYGDSVINSVGDILACVLGFVVASRFSGRAAVAGVAVLELFLAWWIRDGLLLNILMLISPIESVKTWQLGGL